MAVSVTIMAGDCTRQKEQWSDQPTTGPSAGAAMSSDGNLVISRNSRLVRHTRVCEPRIVGPSDRCCIDRLSWQR